MNRTRSSPFLPSQQTFARNTCTVFNFLSQAKQKSAIISSRKRPSENRNPHPRGETCTRTPTRARTRVNANSVAASWRNDKRGNTRRPTHPDQPTQVCNDGSSGAPLLSDPATPPRILDDLQSKRAVRPPSPFSTVDAVLYLMLRSIAIVELLKLIPCARARDRSIEVNYSFGQGWPNE